MNILNIILDLKLTTVLMYTFVLAYVVILITIALIDKNRKKIDKNVLTAGVILSLFYMLYLYVERSVSIYWNVLYLGIYAVLLVIDTFLLRRYAKDSYIIKILMLLNIILIFVDTKMTIYTMMIAGLAASIYIFLLNLDKKRNGNKKIKLEDVPLGYFIGFSNLIALFIITFITTWVR